MLSFVVYAAPYILGVILLVGLIGAYTNLRRARRAPYFRIRRDSARAGWRWVLVILLCGGAIYGAIQARRSLPPPDLTSLLPSPAAPSPTFSLEGFPTPTYDLNATPKEPFAAPPTITPTLPPATLTPTPFITLIQSQVTPPVGAALMITAICSQITTIGGVITPQDPGTNFSAGITRIYVFFNYTHMANGVSVSRALLLDGRVIQHGDEAWPYNAEGAARYWFDAQGGFPAGNYQVQLYIGDRMVAQAAFTLS